MPGVVAIGADGTTALQQAIRAEDARVYALVMASYEQTVREDPPMAAERRILLWTYGGCPETRDASRPSVHNTMELNGSRRFRLDGHNAAWRETYRDEHGCQWIRFR